MKSPDRRTDQSNQDSVRSSLAMLAFGLAILALLVAIERPEWFELRPASGTAAAMFNASAHGDGHQGDHVANATTRMN